MKKISSALLSIMLVITMIIGSGFVSEAAGVTDNQAAKSLFDATYYANQYPDVVAARGKSEAALYKHYIENGIAEGRSGSAEFNAVAYRNRYSDLDAAFGNNWLKYCTHYVTAGKAEGRNARKSGEAQANQAKAPVAEKKDNSSVNQPLTIETSTDGYSCLGSYTTKYDAKIARAINVSLAASRINGVVVQPGSGFSFSQAILPRTPENGYVEATVFINKQKAKGIGGGICQVSSTLYACMKTVGLPATERHPHSLPVTYIPEGYDATIAGTTLDLKFTNTYSTPLMITASADNGVLTISLWLKNN